MFPGVLNDFHSTLRDFERSVNSFFEPVFPETTRRLEGQHRWPAIRPKDSVARRPFTDMTQDDANVYLTVELPGVKKEDMHVEMKGDDTIEITATVAEDTQHETADELLVERQRGAFKRALKLPDNVDASQASAAEANGVLTLTFPKREQPPSEMRVIPIA